MKQIKIVALDMDGTLLDNHGQITERTQQTIQRAGKAGVHVVISTGRPYVGLPVALLQSIGVKYAITCNGAAIYKLPEKICMQESCMEADLVADIMERLQEKKVYFDAFIGGDGYGQISLHHYIDLLELPKATKEYVKTTRTLVADLAEYVRNRQLLVQKVTIQFVPLPDGTYQDREEVRGILMEYPQISFVSGGYHNLEFTRAGISKGKGLGFLAQHFQIPLEQSMACGDSQNDMDIMETAGIGIAMGNAEEEVKKLAEFVTATNQEDGVALAIEKYIF